jgi:hypothetical protein
MSLVSSCCGASPRGNGDSDLSDIGICSECGEHCEYIEEEDPGIETDCCGNCFSDADPGL